MASMICRSRCPSPGGARFLLMAFCRPPEVLMCCLMATYCHVRRLSSELLKKEFGRPLTPPLKTPLRYECSRKDAKAQRREDKGDEMRRRAGICGESGDGRTEEGDGPGFWRSPATGGRTRRLGRE